MENTPTPVSAQEKLAAACGSIIFFIPLLMGVKTAFVVKYMKQGFFINLIQITGSIVSMLIWILGGLIGFVNFILFVISIYIAVQAYNGKDYSFSAFSENAEKMIKALNLQGLFEPQSSEKQ